MDVDPSPLACHRIAGQDDARKL